MRVARIAAAVVLIAVSPVAAHAQADGLTAFLSKATDIGLFYTMGRITSDSPDLKNDSHNLDGFGFELSFTTGAASALHKCRPGEPSTACPTHEPSATNDPPARRDTSWVFELAIGYAQSSGFRSSRDSVDLKGAVRELPMVTVYATHHWIGHPGAPKPYVGLRSGLLQLHDARAYIKRPAPDTTTAKVYSAAASTFQAGVVGGFVATIPGLQGGIFAEGAYTWRIFPSIEWSLGEGGTLPVSLPRKLRMNGPSMSFGFQIPVR